MVLDPESADKLQRLSNELKNEQHTKARMADLATRHTLDANDEHAITEAIRHPEYKEGASIAYTYDSYIDHAESFTWTPGEYVPDLGWAIKPVFNLSLETTPGEQVHDTDLYGLAKSLSGKRFTSKTRRTIEGTAPDLLQIVGLKNGLEIINPYDLQSWMKNAGVLDKDTATLPIKVLVTPPRRSAAIDESDFPERNDARLEELVDALFPEPESTTISGGILDQPDTGLPRGVIAEFTGDTKKIDDERIQNLVEIRDQWQGAYLVETESLIGDKTKYVALILPESGNGTSETVDEWAIAENPQVGNALFVVDPHRLREGVSWRDILMSTSKEQAVARGAVRMIHTQGNWQEQLLDFITSPR